VFYKNTNELNAMEEMNFDKYPNVYVYKDPTEVMVDNLKVLFMPWICSGNYQKAMDAIQNTDAQVVFGHLELSGFAMYKGNINDHGMSPKIFEKFDQVFTGHYHHKSSSGNIHYLGAPYQMTWSDYGDTRGFHIYDSSNRILEYVVNPHEMFHKVVYNDLDKTMDEVLIDCEPYRDTYIKLVVENKTNPYWFDLLINKFEAAGVKDLKILDDGDIIEFDEETIDEAQDTLTILNGFIDQMDIKGDRQDLTDLLRELYREAASSE
jgi:DNA repair exonuclease SbcCD nuclease subunit